MEEDIDYEKFKDIVKSTIKNTQIKTEQSNMRKVFLLGETGVGKSALANNLANEEQTIDTLGDDAIIVGSNVGFGPNSVTTKPRILINTDSGFIIGDNPGFKDTHGIMKEIENATSTNELFENKNCPKKILFCISANNIKGKRKGIDEYIAQLENMFPNIEDLQKCIGLVITMSDSNHSSSGYLSFLKGVSDGRVEFWCDYFLKNIQRVFLFPAPSKHEKGNKFLDFPDRLNLINFLTNNDLDVTNLDHKIGLSNSSKRSLKEFGFKISLNIYTEVDQLIQYIKSYYQNNSNIDEFENYLKTFETIIEEPFGNVDDLLELIYQGIPRNQFEYDMTKIKELDEMNDHIGKILQNNEYISSTTKVIKTKMRDVIKDFRFYIEGIFLQRKLKAKEDELNRRQNQLKNKEDELNDRQDQLNDKEDELNDRQDQLNDKEDELNDRQDQLNDKEDELNDRQNEIINRVRTLETEVESDNYDFTPLWATVATAAAALTTIYIARRRH